MSTENKFTPGLESNSGRSRKGAIERLLGWATARLRGSAAFHYKQGCLHEAANDQVRALDSYDAAIRLDPTLARAHNNRGALLQTAGRWDQAMACYQRARELDPTLWNASYNIGLLCKLHGRFAESMLPFQQAMRARRAPVQSASELPVADRRTTHSKLRHDHEQLHYLAGLNLLDPSATEAMRATQAAIDALENNSEPIVDGWEFPDDLQPLLAPHYNRLKFFHDAPAVPGGALNPAMDWGRVEADYFGRAPGMAFADDFLKPEALASLRRFCLESTIWFDCNYHGGYVGCTYEDGFICPLLVQVAEELRAALPGIIGKRAITGLWGYKYDCQGSGIEPHADYAAVNVNFWLTPDECNLDPSCGGLVVWDREAPLDWDFQAYNNDAPRILAFLRETQAKAWQVPHRQNRVVLFNSDLFHKTDSYRFRPGYESRRVNVTMLYGERGSA